MRAGIAAPAQMVIKTRGLKGERIDVAIGCAKATASIIGKDKTSDAMTQASGHSMARSMMSAQE